MGGADAKDLGWVKVRKRPSCRLNGEYGGPESKRQRRENQGYCDALDGQSKPRMRQCNGWVGKKHSRWIQRGKGTHWGLPKLLS